jgi:FkbM family methyltransferase
MSRPFALLVRQWLKKTPFEVRRWLPTPDLPPLELVLACSTRAAGPETIVQVGACDGVTNDPIHQVVARGSSRAILLEPNPFAFARLQKIYAGVPGVTLIQAAIGESDGEASLYRVKKSEVADTDVDLSIQVASFSRKHVESFCDHPAQVEKIVVPCRTLESVLKSLGVVAIDLLQIDTEGYDGKIVRMSLNLPEPPKCIHFEHVHLPTEDRLPLFELLKSRGYLLSYDLENVLALKKSVLQQITRAANSA